MALTEARAPRACEGAAEPRVLVLMATYNGAAWIDEQLQSLATQRGVRVSLLVSDDGSTDATVERLDRFCRAHDLPVQLLREPGRAGSAGRNFQRLIRSANVSDVDFVALADQDDVWYPDKLARAVEALKAGDSPGYSCAVVAAWPDGREKLLPQVPIPTSHDFLFEGAGQGCSFVLTREFFCRVQHFCITHRAVAETMHYHDWLIYLLCRVWGHTWHFDPHPGLHYRQHESNEIGGRNLGAGLRHRLRLVRSGWYRGQVTAALAVASAASEPGSGPRSGVSSGLPWAGLIRVKRVAWMLRHGRRRLTDRIALAAFALLGWI